MRSRDSRSSWRWVRPSLRQNAAPGSAVDQPITDVAPAAARASSPVRASASATPRRRWSGWVITYSSMAASLTPSISCWRTAPPTGAPSWVATQAWAVMWGGVRNSSAATSSAGVTGSPGDSWASSAWRTVTRASNSGVPGPVTSTTDTPVAVVVMDSG